MNFLPGWNPASVSAGKLDWELVDAQFSDANSTTYTFNPVAVGAADNDKRLYIGVVSLDSAGNVLSNVTVGGNGATQFVTWSAPSSGAAVIGFYGIDYSAGPTASIAVTFSVGTNNCAIYVWRVSKAAVLFPLDAYVALADGVASRNLPLNVAKGGLALYAAFHTNANAAAYSSALKSANGTLDGIVTDAAQREVAANANDYVETRSWSGSAGVAMIGVSLHPRKSPFPMIAGRATAATFFNGTETTFTVPLPTGYAAGDLLMIIVSLRAGGALTVTTPSGWTAALNAVGASNIRRVGVFYKIASGSEGSSVGVTASGAAQWAVLSYAIKRAGAVEAAGLVTGSSAAPAPPTLTPSWGARATLWLPVSVDVQGSTGVPTWLSTPPPSGYNQPLSISHVNLGSNNLRAIAALRCQNAAGVAPGNFTLPGSAEWATTTLGVR